eukprot:70043-Amphidinium_carterae.1
MRRQSRMGGRSLMRDLWVIAKVAFNRANIYASPALAILDFICEAVYAVPVAGSCPLADWRI